MGLRFSLPVLFRAGCQRASEKETGRERMIGKATTIPHFLKYFIAEHLSARQLALHALHYIRTSHVCMGMQIAVACAYNMHITCMYEYTGSSGLCVRTPSIYLLQVFVSFFASSE